jgi:hypothetical protein
MRSRDGIVTATMTICMVSIPRLNARRPATRSHRPSPNSPRAEANAKPRASAEAAHRLLGQVLYPRFPRAFLRIDPLAESFDREALAPDFDLKPIRRAVAELVESLG